MSKTKQKLAKKLSPISRRDLVWRARAFGPTPHGAVGIEWQVEETVDEGTRIDIRILGASLQLDELAPHLRARLASVVEFAAIVNREVESILDTHLANKKKLDAQRTDKEGK